MVFQSPIAHQSPVNQRSKNDALPARLPIDPPPTPHQELYYRVAIGSCLEEEKTNWE